MKKILVTGASGFVGRNLKPYLENKNLALKIISREDLQSLVPLQITGIDTIVHLAGKAHDLKNVDDPTSYYDVNFGLTKLLYDAFLKSDAKKFIFISSVKAAADVVNGILTEESVPNPQTHYGKSKLMAEDYICSKELPDGKFFYILRPCMIHGPGNKGNLNLLFNFVKKGIPYPLGAYKNRRSFLSVENLCFVIYNLVEMGNVDSGLFQVADDVPLSTQEVAQILANALDKRLIVLNVPKIIVKAMSSLGDKLKLPITSERINKLTESYVVSNTKITRTLGASLPLSSSDGLKLTAKSFVK